MCMIPQLLMRKAWVVPAIDRNCQLIVLGLPKGVPALCSTTVDQPSRRSHIDALWVQGGYNILAMFVDAEP